MRKLIFTLISILCLTISCKQTKETKPIEANNKMVDAAVDKDSIKEIIVLLDKIYCNTEDFKASESIHKIDSVKFHEMIGKRSKNPKKLSWNYISSKFNDEDCPYKYIAFKGDPKADNNDLDIEMIDSFTLDRTCYSIALFKGVVSENNLQKNDEFLFYKATNAAGKYTVIFSVKGNTNMISYYDISENPTQVVEILKTYYNLNNQDNK